MTLIYSFPNLEPLGKSIGSIVPCPVLTDASWPTYRFLRRQVRCLVFPSLEEFSSLLWLGTGGKGDDRGWDGWMASPTRWMWVCVNSGSWWWTGRPGVLKFMGLQRVGHGWVTEMNWNWTDTVKGFGIINKEEVGVFLELSCFSYDPMDIGNLISGSSAFSKTSLNIWKIMVHIPLKPGLENFEHYFASV